MSLALFTVTSRSGIIIHAYMDTHVYTMVRAGVWSSY